MKNSNPVTSALFYITAFSLTLLLVIVAFGIASSFAQSVWVDVIDSLTGV